MIKKLLFTFLVSMCLVSVSVNTWAQCPISEAVDFTVTDIEGNEHQLFDILDNQNKYVLIDFFFTTCGPCQIVAPRINEAYEYFGCNTGDVVFLGIDSGNNDAQCAAFDEQFGVHYPTISGTEGGGNAVCELYQISAYPTVILIAPNHDIVIQDIWPISSAQTIISKLEPFGIEEHSCNDDLEEDSAVSVELKVWPNPSSTGVFNIATTSAKQIQLLVSDLSGKQLYTSKQSSMQQVDLSHLPKGMYILQMQLGESIVNKSVIIQ